MKKVMGKAAYLESTRRFFSMINAVVVQGLSVDLLQILSEDHPTNPVMLKVTKNGEMVIGGSTFQIRTIKTVSTLPTCNSGAEGTFAAVSDAAATPVYNATVASGGSVHISVYCNGTNWVNH